ncbi:MAG: hypothetical protein KDK37_16955, partial [Leptospiraceae bacterium]|nr:hypothetical protein [Leptospiraceae bacterium]
MKTKNAMILSLLIGPLALLADPVQVSNRVSLTNPTRAVESEQSAATFRFDLKKGDVLTVDKLQDITLARQQSQGSREERNKIILKVTENQTPKESRPVAILEGEFHTYARTPAGVGPFKKEQAFRSQFSVSDLGHYEVSDHFIMPNLRSLPTFPEEEIKQGQSWIAPAMETMDLQGEKIKIDMNVKYRYEGEGFIIDREGKRRKAQKIVFSYQFVHPVNRPNFPLRKIVGLSKDELWFDTELGIPI